MTRPLLALHAMFMHGAAMAPLAEALGREIIAPGLPGHRRGPPWVEGRDYMEQAVDAALAAMPDEPIDVFGHSLGATVALHVAVARPEQVRSLTIFEPALFSAASGAALNDYLMAMKVVSDALETGREGTAAAEFHAHWGTGAAWEDLPTNLRKTILRLIPLVPATEPAVVHDKHGLLPQLRACPVPVLVLQQEAHQQLPVMASICEGLRSLLPNVTVRSVAGEGRHMLPVTAPQAVAAVVAAFWADLP
mgnify:CR=1 FL=1